MNSPGFFISRGRVYLVVFTMIIIWGLLIARLVQIQFIDGDRYRQLALKQVEGEVVVPAERGRILDCEGRVLAGNIARKSYFAYPQTMDEATNVAEAAATVLETSPKTLNKKLSKRVEQFTWLCRKLTNEQSAPLENRMVRGLFCQKEMQRLYPSNGLGRDLLGAVDIDNQGISGLEYALDSLLSGENGRTIIEKDAVGKSYRIAATDLIPPRNGCDVTLTIDLDWQSIVEQELEWGVDSFAAKSGTIVLLKPSDGAVLAMASYRPNGEGSESQKNEAIADLFEPGSSYKLITAAGVLEEGVMTPSTVINCGHGVAQFSGRLIHDDKVWDNLTLQDVFRYSSNIGIGKASIMLGSKNLFKYAKYFGFGIKSGIDLPGESPGSLREPLVWSDHFTASLAMGHGVSVNALQMAAAYSVVVSGGALYQPYLIRQLSSPDGLSTEVKEPRKIRTILSSRTCEILKGFMAAVVDSGTAKYSKSQSVDFGGKTGTGQKPNLETGGYYQNRFISTFAGFFPREKPVAVGIVVLDDPQPVHYAGMTSAKIFAHIAERIASLEKVTIQKSMAASVKKKPERIFVPDLQGYTLSSARELLDSLQLDILMVNAGELIVGQNPPPATMLAPGERLVLYLTATDTTISVDFADLIGQPVKTALPKLMERGYEVELVGSGFVKSITTIDTTGEEEKKRCQVFCDID